jgi:hypothetical protein
MEAHGSLSKSQTLTLETVYLFLRTLRPILLSLGNSLEPTSREVLDAQIRLAQLNEDRLVEFFPAVADAAQRWSVKP